MTGDLIEEVRTSRDLPGRERARAIRRAAGVSRSRLAQELGVHEVTVARWERGTRRPRGRLRLQYAQALHRLDEAMQRG